jgi:predicted TIM-barrel fold metal-dependent hydrolase
MDVEAGNDLVERVVREAGDQVVGLSSVDPSCQTPEEIVAVCERFHLGGGFRGFKPYYPRNGIPYDDPGYAPYWEFGNRYGLYALLHTDESPAMAASVADLADRYPALTFIFAHSGGSWRYAGIVAETCRKRPNIAAELTYTPVHNGIVEWLVENAGADRVLFGSDAPMRDPRPQLGWVVHSRLAAREKEMVLGSNFASILSRCRLPGRTLPQTASSG